MLQNNTDYRRLYAMKADFCRLLQDVLTLHGDNSFCHSDNFCITVRSSESAGSRRQ